MYAAFDHCRKFLSRDGFDEVVSDALFKERSGKFRVGVSGEYDERYQWIVRKAISDRFKAVRERHSNITYNDVDEIRGGLRRQKFDSLGPFATSTTS